MLNLRENWREHTSEDDKVIGQPEFGPVSRVERDIFRVSLLFVRWQWPELVETIP